MLGAKQDFCSKCFDAKEDFCYKKIGYIPRLLLMNTLWGKAELLFNVCGAMQYGLVQTFGVQSKAFVQTFWC